MLVSNRKISFLIISSVISLTYCFEEYVNVLNEENMIGDHHRNKSSYRIPGTYWCGAGSIAKHYNQLGKFSAVDRCCRAHDVCDSMERGQQKYGLKNSFMISKLHCQCDKEFRQCLQRIGTKVANTVGRLYFSIQDKCYREAHPIIGCRKKARSLMRTRCSHYVTDVTQPRKYQWFDLPFYFDPLECDAFKET